MATVRDNPLIARLRSAGHIIVDEPPKFDLDVYISNYRGRTRFARLLHIGTTSSYLSIDALKTATAEAKSSHDPARYEEASALLAEAVPENANALLDTAWIEATRQTNKVNTDKMELELKGYKNNLIKESIRMGHQDLGKQCQNTGDLAGAAKSFTKMYDYMTTNGHLVTMCMHLILVAIEQRNWYSVTMNAQRIWGSGNTKYEEAVKQSSKLVSALGLAELASRNFESAAEQFLNVDPRMTQAKLDDPLDEESYNEVLTPNDVAIYGALCALASFDRSKLQSKVLDHKTFRNYLELEPHLRRAITFFIASKYSVCLSILEAWKVDYLLDIYLSPCFDAIIERVRRKAIQQYFIPFSCVSLGALAKAFNTDVPVIRNEVTQMIKRGELNARIDLVNSLLLSRKSERKIKVQSKALRLAQDYERTAQLRILRMGIVNAGLEVKPSKDKTSLAQLSGQSLSYEGLYDGPVSGDILPQVTKHR